VTAEVVLQLAAASLVGCGVLGCVACALKAALLRREVVRW
jgi:hypothetical protein